jgi:allantoate deiminase
VESLYINQERLCIHLEELSQIGKIGETGVCRLAHSKEDREAVEKVKGWMLEAGLSARIDDFGNLIGRLEGENPNAPILLIGSHIDSQPFGGRFDGTVGVLGALEVVQTMNEKGIIPKIPIEVIAFSDEEGCRFNKGVFGSRGIIGEAEEGELERKDKFGITRREALQEFGCDPNHLQDSVYQSGSIHAFLELHIEQGPVLEEVKQPVGIVSGIAGPLWQTVTFKGFAGHAGSVPMHLRKDALVGASEVIVEFNKIVKINPNASTVGTVGSLRIFPDSRNSIPEQVEFTIDLRDIDLLRRNQYEQELAAAIEKAAEKNGLTYSIREDTRSDPKYCAEWIKKILIREAQGMGLDAPTLMSGPFHDALILSKVCDYGMIFVRCKDGISHNPLEYASLQDIAQGTDLLYRSAVSITQDTCKSSE